MSASTVELIRLLAAEFPEFRPLLEEHLADNDGELLPHLLMADVIRWLVVHRTDRSARVASAFDRLEEAFAQGDGDVKDLIAVSGVEMIPDPGQPGSELRSLQGPNLAGVDPWRSG